MLHRMAWVALLLSCLGSIPASASHQDGIDTWVTIDANGSLRLQWTGGQPEFTVYRSTDPRAVVDPRSAIGTTPDRVFVDQPPPGLIFYYEITSPCLYAPPEVCDGVDNDCDGLVDGPAADASCGDATTCTLDRCVAGACRNVDVSRCAVPVCAFAQSWPGCPNPDTDADGLGDTWEDAGAIDLDCDGDYDSDDVVIPDANRRVKDVYLKISWMPAAPGEPNPDGHKPPQEAIDAVVAAFAGSHLTAPPARCEATAPCPRGFSCSPADAVCLPECITDANCGAGVCVQGLCRLRRLHLDDAAMNPVPHANVLFFGPVRPACITGGNQAEGVNFYDLKADPANFDSKTALFMRYGIFGHMQSCDAPLTCSHPLCPDVGGARPDHQNSGLAEIMGNDFMVTLAGFPWVQGPPETLQHNEQAGTLLHELGHTLGLCHDGLVADPSDPSCADSSAARSPQHLSVMNHLYTFGVPVADAPGSVTPNPAKSRIDFSHAALPPLDESALDEVLGVGPGNPPPWDTDLVRFFNPHLDPLTRYGSTAPGQPINWNAADPIVSAPVTVDLDRNGAIGALRGAGDWDGLHYDFQCRPGFQNGTSPPPALATDEIDPVIALETDQLLPGLLIRHDLGVQCIDAASGVHVPDVIYGSDDFDVLDIDQSTLRLSEAAPQSVSFADEDHDGYLDLKGTFHESDMVLPPVGAAFVALGKLLDGRSFQGEDAAGCPPGSTCVGGVCVQGIAAD